MTRTKRKKVRRQFLQSVAVELESHLGNGSGFIFQEMNGDDSPDDVVAYRTAILERLVEELYRKAER